jgi:hypothetical protein
MIKRMVGSQIGIKSWESTRFPHVQATCNIPLESLQQGLQHCFKLHCNRRSAHEVMHPQSCKSLSCGRLPFGSLGTKCHLDVAPMERRKEYYKGEGGGFPQVQVVVSLLSPRLLMARPSTQKC